MTKRVRLGVNIDHVATVRNARGGTHPDPVRAAEAALAAGFSDQAHLTRAFKERLGMTPGFYQRAIAGADPADALASSPEQVRP